MDTNSSIGVNLRVTAHSNQGGRKYMEDMFCVAYQPTADERDLLYAYFGIFDGHGGRDAAIYAKQHLMDCIVAQKNFWSDDDELILKAIREGFIQTHYAMWRELESWPKTPSGLPSTSGTTASVAFVRRGKLYIGHVGDSGIVLGYQDPSGYWRAKPLTKDHKPESTTESARISRSGGKVMYKSGVPRVVWNRPRIGHKGPVRRSTPIDEIPFLAVARSLGDLWSYNSDHNQFVVSPEPDVSVVAIDVNSFRCLILGSDGLWNMLNAQDAVNSVFFAEKSNEKQLLASPPETASSRVKNWINPSKRLVDRALEKWNQHSLRADNTSVVTVVIDPPGPPKAQVLRQNQRSSIVRQSVPTGADSSVPRRVPPQVSSGSFVNRTSQSVVSNLVRSSTPYTPSRVPPRVGNAPSPAANTIGQEIPSSASEIHRPSPRVSSSVHRPAQPSAASASRPSTAPHNDTTRTTSRVDDVQIYEISSSSESGARTSLLKSRTLQTTGTSHSQTRRIVVGREVAKTSNEPRLVPQHQTRRSYPLVLIEPVDVPRKKAKITKPEGGQASTRKNPGIVRQPVTASNRKKKRMLSLKLKSLKAARQHHLLKSTVTGDRHLRGSPKSLLKENMGLKQAAIPVSSSSRVGNQSVDRNLRSKTMAAKRVTRSMKK